VSDLPALAGLHHVTAITGDARGNIDFYTRVLGMRLVKKTVNQDDVSAYHLFYADATGSPGTDLTFFDWPHAASARPGAPAIGPTALRIVDDVALEWWAGRLREHGVEPGPTASRGGRLRLPFTDPEGQALELVSEGGARDGGVPAGTPWPRSPVPEELQVRGLHGVTLESLRPELTELVLTEVMGFRRLASGEGDAGGDGFEDADAGYETGTGGPGTEVRLRRPVREQLGRQGRGGVHHVAFRVPDEAVQLGWRARVEQSGLRPTPVIDRFYFRSVYFREPGGVLFEIATDGPGFAADEDREHLGERLALPPFLEPKREAIEAGLAGLP
jgi:glyoxalase family protein